MLTNDKKIQQIGVAKTHLETAIEHIFDAGKIHDSVTSIDTDAFFKLRQDIKDFVSLLDATEQSIRIRETPHE